LSDENSNICRASFRERESYAFSLHPAISSLQFTGNALSQESKATLRNATRMKNPDERITENPDAQFSGQLTIQENIPHSFGQQIHEINVCFMRH